MKRTIAAFLITVMFVFSGTLNAFADEIQPAPIALSDCEITLSSYSVVYRAVEIRTGVSVSYGGQTFKRDTDYTVAFANNINVGTAQVTVTATDNGVLSGSETETFKITRKDISVMKNKVLSETDFVYTGNAVTPSLDIYNSNFNPVSGQDYTLTYKNNVKTGTATVVAKGVGNYMGTVKKSFYIHPKKVTGLKYSTSTASSYTLKWNAASGSVTGYKLYRYNKSSKKYDYIGYSSDTTYKITGRPAATANNYIVRAYKVSGGKTIYGDYSKAKLCITKPAEVQTHDSSFSGKYFICKWDKVNASGYIIQYSKNKKFKSGVKTITVKSSKAKSKKLKISKNKTYYYRVRAYKTYKGKTYNGAWSQKKTTYFSNVYSTYTTYFNSPAGRTTNIKLAAKKIDGLVLKPGETFSFNNTVGRRTAARGFKVATVFSGSSHVMGYGGGVCQVSSTLFNAALIANLKVVERHQHSMKVSYVPSGRDAAISWGTQDMKFRNDTNYEIKISMKVYDSSKLVVKLLTNSNKSPKKVSLNVSTSGNRYTLKRTVGGKVNYTTSSTY